MGVIAGQIIPRGKNKWLVRIFQGRDPNTGKRQYHNQTVHGGKKHAEDYLAKMLTAKTSGYIVGKVPVNRLLDMVEADYKMQGKGMDGKGVNWASLRINKHLRPSFGNMDASKLGTETINRYIIQRQEKGRKSATINRELALLRYGYTLGLKATPPLVMRAPHIPKLREDNVRKGFIEHETYRRILLSLPRHQQMLFCFAYHWGVRKGELLKLRWEWLLPYWHEEEPIIKVPGYGPDGRRITKSGEPHTLPLYDREMRAFVAMALAERDPNCPYLFQYQGRQLRDTRTGWANACKAAGVPNILFHDTRRTAIRLMEQAGIRRADAMQVTGHKTESSYKRYDLANERGAIDTGRKMREHKTRMAELEESRNTSPISSSGVLN